MTIYLYIKMCLHCGKKYFGKTTRPNPFKYMGSGKHWINHYKKHGKEHIITIGYYIFENQEKATKFALEFSERHNIVNSEEWFNKIPENALDGFPIGNKIFLGRKHTKETKQKISNRFKDEISPLKGRTYEEIHGEEKAKELKRIRSDNFSGPSPLKGRTYEEIHGEEKAKALRKLRSDNNPGKDKSQETINKQAETLKRRYASGEILHYSKYKKVNYNGGFDQSHKVEWICPHCNKSGRGLANKTRWHFENCRKPRNILEFYEDNSD